MSYEELIRYVREPETISASDQRIIFEFKQKYPCFSLAQWLYLKSLQVSDSIYFDKEKNNRNDNVIEEIMQADFPLPKQAEDAKNEAFSRIREMAAASGNVENTENMVQRLREKSTEKSTKKSTESSGKKSTGTVKYSEVITYA